MGFDFSTAEVLDWEVQAVWEALDSGELRVSVHAQNEINLDALTLDDVYVRRELRELRAEDRSLRARLGRESCVRRCVRIQHPPEKSYDQ